MKKLVFVLLAVALFVPVSALGQDTAKPSAPDRDSSHNQPALSKPANISGKVGEGGKTFTSSKNYLLLVTNPEILKDFVGQLVKVKCRFSRVSDSNEIRIISVKMIQIETKYVANKGDSAFRR
jgi:hypothetical protein